MTTANSPATAPAPNAPAIADPVKGPILDNAYIKPVIIPTHDPTSIISSKLMPLRTSTTPENKALNTSTTAFISSGILADNPFKMLIIN